MPHFLKFLVLIRLVFDPKDFSLDPCLNLHLDLYLFAGHGDQDLHGLGLSGKVC
jgi:hypothetical protein